MNDKDLAHNIAQALHNGGYLYLGIKDAPKPMSGAEAIIRSYLSKAMVEAKPSKVEIDFHNSLTKSQRQPSLKGS